MAYKQSGNPFKKTKYISAAEGFDPLGVEQTLKDNPYAMMSKDYTRVPQGEFSREATLKDQRAEYQRRIKANQKARITAKGGSWEYINPHTGEVTTRGPKPDPTGTTGGTKTQGNVETSMQGVDVGGDGGVDWQKVDEGRRQRAANTARYGMTGPESRKFQRQQNRATRRSQRQQRRDARRLQRQIKRRNSGGFLSRLFGW